MKTVPTIKPGSITSMSGLENRPVFFLCLHGAPRPTLVVKGESLGSGGTPANEISVSVKWGSKIMKNVNNRLVNTKIMTRPEIKEFRAVAARTFASNSRQAMSAQQNCLWVKMPMVSHLTDADYWSDVGSHPVPTRIKNNIKKFLTDTVWRELGEIVAVDIFNGNNDRFSVPDGAWVNKGNVMFLEHGATKVIGLDTYDPAAGEQSNLASGGGFDDLNILIDPIRRKNFAQKCTQSVGDDLSRHLQSAGVVHVTLKMDGVARPAVYQTPEVRTLFKPFAEDFQNGIVRGADKLKRYLQGKVQQYAAPKEQSARPRRQMLMGAHRANKTVPQGILDRMAFLGWDV